MLKRILTAAVLILVLVGTFAAGLFVSPYFIDAVVWLCSLVALHEMHGALKKAGYDPIVPGLVVAGVTTVPLAAWLGAPGAIAGVSLGMIAALAVFTAKHNYELKDLATTALALIYPLALTSIFSLINHGYGGFLGLLLAIVVPVMTDTMAYFVGVTVGGKKLCPNISPKKTISGAIGGIIGGVLGAFLIFVLFDWTNAISERHYLTDDLWLSLALYLVLGLAGVPIFTKGGGIGYVLQPTFGYLIGFASGAVIAALICSKGRYSYPRLIAAGLVNMIYQAIGSSANFIAGNTGIDDFVLIGNMSLLPQCAVQFDRIAKLYGLKFHIPEYREYRTALGAALSEAGIHAVQVISDDSGTGSHPGRRTESAAGGSAE